MAMNGGYPAARSADGQRENAIRQLFRQMAGADRHLDANEIQRLASNIAAQFKIPVGVFGDINLMFYRYDFSGDGRLDEQEGVNLIQGLIRAANQKRDPKAAHASLRSARDLPFRKLEQAYEMKKKLGQGGQGAVYLATDKSNGQDKVVKFYDKSDANAPAEDIINEFKLLMGLDHPKIARVYDIFQDTANIYVVNEPLFGGDLSTAVQKATENGVQLTEQWFCNIWKQSLEGVAFLHTKSMMHCDIKEPNIMISGKNDFANPNVVVIDFGLAQDFGAGSMPGGTPGYMPPEVWSYGLWTPKGDTFSMGITFYSMVTMNGSPFYAGANSVEAVQANTMRCMVPRTGYLAQPNGANMANMIFKMLGRDFKQRPTIAQVLQRDPFFRSASGAGMQMDTAALQKLSKMQEMDKLQKGLVADMASRENLTQLGNLSKAFESMDKDNDGTVTKEEARQALTANGLDSNTVESLISSLIGDSKSVSYTAFMGQLMAAKKGNMVSTLRKIFDDLDKDGSGYLDQAELQAMTARPEVAEAMRGMSSAQIIQAYGWSGKQRVTWEDFREAFETSASPQNTKSRYQQDDKVEYFSPSQGAKWIPAKVVEVRSDGAIQLNVKPGFWFTMKDQLPSKIRKQGEGSSAGVGLNILAQAMSGFSS